MIITTIIACFINSELINQMLIYRYGKIKQTVCIQCTCFIPFWIISESKSDPVLQLASKGFHTVMCFHNKTCFDLWNLSNVPLYIKPYTYVKTFLNAIKAIIAQFRIVKIVTKRVNNFMIFMFFFASTQNWSEIKALKNHIFKKLSKIFRIFQILCILRNFIGSTEVLRVLEVWTIMWLKIDSNSLYAFGPIINCSHFNLTICLRNAT